MIATQRLELLPYTPEHWLALIESEQVFAAQFGTPPADGLRAFIVSDEVSPDWIEQLHNAESPDLWVHGLGIVHKESQLVIGDIGFKGPPDAEGCVEIAYGIVPAFENQGYATEAAGAIVDFLYRDPRVRLICAHTLQEPNASTNVLKKCGFEYQGEVVDPEDGPVWRWEHIRYPRD